MYLFVCLPYQHYINISNKLYLHIAPLKPFFAVMNIALNAIFMGNVIMIQ